MGLLQTTPEDVDDVLNGHWLITTLIFPFHWNMIDWFSPIVWFKSTYMS